MAGLSLNIEFNYLYRDAANYKQFGSVVFANTENKSIAELEAEIRERLIDGEFFEPLKVNIPSINAYPHNSELDHNWYEFEEIQATSNPVTDNRTITGFINQL